MLAAFEKLHAADLNRGKPQLIDVIEDLRHLVLQANIMRDKFHSLKNRVKRLMDLVSVLH
jgi:hypothetical protein